MSKSARIRSITRKVLASLLSAVLAITLVPAVGLAPAQKAEAATKNPITLTNVNTGKVTLKAGQTYKIGAKFTKAKKPSYKSSRTSVVSVSSKGTLKAKKTGKATVTVSCTSGKKKFKKTISVTVVSKRKYKKVKSIKLKPSKKKAYAGTYITTKTYFNPTKASNKNLRFYTNNSKVATVSSKGTIKCVAPGSVTITAKSVDGSKKSSTKITVVRKATATKPSTPPTTPESPKDPTSPDEPVAPDTPATPEEPDTPATPEEPDTPDKPVDPEEPATPSKTANPANDFYYEAGSYSLFYEGSSLYAVYPEAIPSSGSWTVGDSQLQLKQKYGPRFIADIGNGEYFEPIEGFDCGEGIYITGIKGSVGEEVIVPDTIDGKPVVCICADVANNAKTIDVSLCKSLKAVELYDDFNNQVINRLVFGELNSTIQSLGLLYVGLVEKLDLSPLSDLRALCLSRCNGLGGWTNAPKTLECYREECIGFESLTLSDYPNLRDVTISGGGYDSSKVSISNCPAIESLDISNNSFSSFDLSPFPNLKRFTCYENNLTSLDISSNNSLESLIAWDNPFDQETIDVLSQWASEDGHEGSFDNSDPDDPTTQDPSADGWFQYAVGTLLLEDTETVLASEIADDGTFENQQGVTYTVNESFGSYFRASFEEWSNIYEGLNCGKGAYITAINDSASGVITIPDEINGEPVVCVHVRNIPDSVTGIDFSKCTSLKAARLEGDVQLEFIVFGPSNATVDSLHFRTFEVSQKLDLSDLSNLKSLEFNSCVLKNGYTSDCNLERYSEAFMNLPNLTIGGESLREIEITRSSYSDDTLVFSNSPNLKTLAICVNSELTALDCTAFPNLERLDCSFNDMLASLNISANSHLVSLSCSDCNLQSLSISTNCALEELYCDSNNLSTLNLTGAKSLRKLYCGSNSLSELNVSGLTALEDLNCSRNTLSAIDLSESIALESLSCYENNLGSLDLSKNERLEHLDCSDNQMSSLVVSDTTNPYLDTIYATGNSFDEETVATLNAWLDGDEYRYGVFDWNSEDE